LLSSCTTNIERQSFCLRYARFACACICARQRPHSGMQLTCAKTKKKVRA
jgi:hypothetical protein